MMSETYTCPACNSKLFYTTGHSPLSVRIFCQAMVCPSIASQEGAYGVGLEQAFEQLKESVLAEVIDEIA